MNDNSANQNAVSDGAAERLLLFLSERGIPYHALDHEPAGNCDIVSRIRGNDLHHAVKAMVIMVKIGKKGRQYFLVAVPGDKRVNLDAVSRHAHGDEARFAPDDRATMLTGCPMGAVPPISFHPDLTLLVDPELLTTGQVVFNAGRLDQSIFVDATAFFSAAGGTVLTVAT